MESEAKETKSRGKAKEIVNSKKKEKEDYENRDKSIYLMKVKHHDKDKMTEDSRKGKRKGALWREKTKI